MANKNNLRLVSLTARPLVKGKPPNEVTYIFLGANRRARRKFNKITHDARKKLFYRAAQATTEAVVPQI